MWGKLLRWNWHEQHSVDHIATHNTLMVRSDIIYLASFSRQVSEDWIGIIDITVNVEGDVLIHSSDVKKLEVEVWNETVLLLSLKKNYEFEFC